MPSILESIIGMLSGDEWSKVSQQVGEKYPGPKQKRPYPMFWLFLRERLPKTLRRNRVHGNYPTLLQKTMMVACSIIFLITYQITSRVRATVSPGMYPGITKLPWRIV